MKHKRRLERLQRAAKAADEKRTVYIVYWDAETGEEETAATLKEQDDGQWIHLKWPEDED